MTTPQDAVLVALRRIIRATDQNSKRLRGSTGLTVPQVVLLRAIAAHPGATLGFLTAQVSLSQATVTTILDRLEERGLVARQRNARDKRVVNVSLTPAGEALLAAAPSALQEEFQQRFSALPTPQRDLIVAALDNVAAMMGAGDLDAAPILTLGNIPEQLPARAVTTLAADTSLRPPTADDGAAVHALVRICPPLDQNSLYANLLQCTHFADTCVVAERSGNMVGFVSGYRLPQQDDTLFIWQVAVHPQARGQQLAARMLDHLLTRDPARPVRHLHTTVTAGNAPSMALFTALAGRHGATLARTPLFDRQRHLNGSHDSEWLLQIGPFAPGGAARAATPAAAGAAGAHTGN